VIDPPPVNEGAYGKTGPSDLSIDCMATVLRGDLRVGAGAADDKPMVLVGESTFPPIVPIRDTDPPLRRGVWRAPLAGILWLVSGMDLLAGFALLMVTTSNAEGGNKLVHRGAFLFFGMDDVFQVCYFCSISTNDKMKLCSN